MLSGQSLLLPKLYFFGFFKIDINRCSGSGMKYPVIIHKDEDTGYGVTLPDIPGCFSLGDTLDEAIRNIQVAVELYYDG